MVPESSWHETSGICGVCDIDDRIGNDPHLRDKTIRKTMMESMVGKRVSDLQTAKARYLHLLTVKILQTCSPHWLDNSCERSLKTGDRVNHSLPSLHTHYPHPTSGLNHWSWPSWSRLDSKYNKKFQFCYFLKPAVLDGLCPWRYLQRRQEGTVHLSIHASTDIAPVAGLADEDKPNSSTRMSRLTVTPTNTLICPTLRPQTPVSYLPKVSHEYLLSFPLHFLSVPKTICRHGHLYCKTGILLPCVLCITERTELRGWWPQLLSKTRHCSESCY